MQKFIGVALRSASALTAIAAFAQGVPVCAQTIAYHFDIPAQDLGKALKAFARTTRQQVSFDAGSVRGKSAPALKGEFTSEAALARLLEGSGLVVQRGRSGIYIIRPASSAATAADSMLAEADAPAEDQEIVVTGTNIRGASPTSPVLRITRRDIETSGRGSIADVIRTLPQNFGGGQNVGNVGSAAGAANQDLTGASSPNLRGLGTASTLTLVNGHRLAFNGYQGGSDISGIPLAAVESVEVLTDGASAIYGSDAVAGVINIRLRRDYQGLETRARIAGTTDGGAFQQQYSALGGTRWATGSVLLSYEYANTDGLDRTQRSYTTAISPYSYSLSPAQGRHSVFGALRQDLFSGVSLVIDGLYTKRENTSQSSAAAYLATQTFKVDQYGINAGLNVDIGGGWSGNVTGTLAQDKSVSLGRQTTLPAGTLTNFNPLTYRNRVRGVEATANGTLFELPSGPVKLALGGGYRWTQYSQISQAPSATTISGGSRSDTFAYGEMYVPLVREDADRDGLNQLALSFAARYDHFNDFGGTTNPKIGILYKPVPDLALRGSWSTSFRASELYFTYGATQRYLFALTTPVNGKSTFLLLYGSNGRLDPERSNSWNLSAEYKPSWLEGARFGVSGYVIKYRDRVGFPFSPYTIGVNNPTLYASYYTYNPSAAEQAAAIGSVQLVNRTTGTYDPANVAFILNSLYQNIGRVTSRGVDVDFRYDWKSGISSFSLSGSASYLIEKQQISAEFPVTQTSNRLFHPTSFRARGGLDWSAGEMGAGVFVNYTGGYQNNISTQQNHVGSWTTVDARLSFTPKLEGLASGISVAVAAQNLLNQAPPHVAADSFNFISGVGFDPTNASPLGRILSIEIAKRW
ncbi:TonB-dependent receptor [Sphingomonas sp. HITSZ_GF]|uniref:TonB-dependent receptor n=1 Tax=Sphingomonas sp. HITSZ_GF TaxID=3037247 RepID=UPI00240DB51D|nr:TonB-dependent receptor [Sphingomonas sp. HITSZ_GF]MDG2535362.1 TonB-dependent receptor [Sphingomonas sp. HITSZ_GF]